jgi:hypothetical protein
MDPIQLKNTQGVLLSISPTKSNGRPGTVDGVPVWTSQDTSIATVEPAPDGLSCKVLTAADAVGGTSVLVEADADIGAGVQPISASVDVVVSDPNVSNLNLTAGEIFEKTPA